jgi:hypothetical protein
MKQLREQRQSNGEGRPLPFTGAAGGHCAAVRFDDTPADGQAQP